MQNLKHKYKLFIQGNDIDAKAAQKLKIGDSLKFVRMTDVEDTYEIVVTTAQGKEMDMLSYQESIGIAPFIDEGILIIENIIVDEVTVEKGKSRAKDNTIVTFTVNYGYETDLKPIYTDDILSFIPNYDIIMATAIYKCLKDETTFDKVYLNCYEMDYPVTDKELLQGDQDFENGDFKLNCMVLFNNNFTKCKVTTKLYNEDYEYIIKLPTEILESALELVNHQIIFEGADPLKCEIEVE